jgi:hypothetical protein
MGEKLPEELVEKMMPALNELAELIGDGIEPDYDTLKGILSRIGLGNDGNALDVFERWSELLRRCNDISDNTEQKEEIIAALQVTGIPEAPAILAVNRATRKPLTCEPDVIDFKVLRPGEAANATLRVSGLLLSAQSHDKRLGVALFSAKSTETLVKIMLQAGQAGESLNDEVVLQGKKVEIRVPVTARWGVAKLPVIATEVRKTELLQVCPICKAIGTHGEGSLFWNEYDKRYECFSCRACGPSLDKLRRLR